MLPFKTKVRKLEESILKIQEKCDHPGEHLEAIFKSNTGGYDGPSFDSYWVRFQCLACGKRWAADSKKNREDYDRPSKGVKEFTDLGAHLWKP